jgi:hypothetical protein
MDSRAYGTRASMSVRDAPGTDMIHPRRSGTQVVAFAQTGLESRFFITLWL